jgi:hypothetical protein
VPREVRCNGCRSWFAADEAVCPSCGHERPGYNRWLRTAKLNSHLYAQAEAAVAEEKRYKESVQEEIRTARRLGIEPAPERPSPLSPSERALLR